MHTAQIVPIGDRLLSYLLRSQIADPEEFQADALEIMDDLHRARKYIRSRDMVANFSLQLADPYAEIEVTAAYGYNFLATGLSVVYDGSQAESPLVNVSWGNREHPDAFAFESGQIQLAPAVLVAGPASSNYLTEARDYLRAVADARTVIFKAQRSAVDAVPARAVSVVLHGWEIALNWRN